MSIFKKYSPIGGIFLNNSVYYNVRLKKNKLYLAERDPVFGLLRITDELGEETGFEPDEFEVVKVLERGGMPDDGERDDI